MKVIKLIKLIKIKQMRKKIIMALGTLLLAGSVLGMTSLSHEEQPIPPELLAEAAALAEVEEEPEETVEEPEIKVCIKGCTLETGHEGDCVLAEAKEDIQVVLKSTSVERDLKVKFVDKKTGKVISGAAFKMKVTSPSKKTKEYSDHDNDGIIWVKNIDGGTYQVAMLELDGYVTAKSLSAEVKNKIEYKVIEVEEEVKNESQVEVPKEDGAYGGTDKDESTSNSTALKDTVEFVESSKEEVTKETDVQKVDEFGQKVFAQRKLDELGQPMFAKILEESAEFHTDGAVADNLCERCGAVISTETDVVDKNEDSGTAETETQTEDSKAPENPEGSQDSENLGDTEPQKLDSQEEAAPILSWIFRPFRFLRASSEQTTERFIKYDETSAPIYDETSAPIYEVETVTKYYGWQTLEGATYYFDKNGEKVTGQQVIQGISYTFSSEGVRSGTIGIDVSKYQTGIDWNRVKNAGINFVMIRCGYRGYGTGVLVEDPMYASHIKGAKAAGLRVGVYFFSQAVNEAEAVEEASMAVKLASKYGINMPIAIDSEYANHGSGRADKLSKSERTKITKAFCNTVKSAGYTPMVYASRTWFADHLDVSQLSGYRIWVAHYAETCGYKGTYHIWQNTDKGKVDGVPGYVDMNISSI